MFRVMIAGELLMSQLPLEMGSTQPLQPARGHPPQGKLMDLLESIACTKRQVDTPAEPEFCLLPSGGLLVTYVAGAKFNSF